MSLYFVVIAVVFTIACAFVVYFHRAHLKDIANQTKHDVEVEADNLKESIADGTAVYGQKADAIVKATETEIKAAVEADFAKAAAEADDLKKAL